MTHPAVETDDQKNVFTNYFMQWCTITNFLTMKIKSAKCFRMNKVFTFSTAVTRWQLRHEYAVAAFNNLEEATNRYLSYVTIIINTFEQHFLIHGT